MTVKNQDSKSTKIRLKVEKRLNGIDVTKLFPEQLAAANKHLAQVNFPPKNS